MLVNAKQRQFFIAVMMPEPNKKALCKIPAGTKVKCYGYYTMANGVKWLYIQFVLMVFSIQGSHPVRT